MTEIGGYVVSYYYQRCQDGLRESGYPHVFATSTWPAVRDAGIDAVHQWCHDNLTDFQIHAEMRAIIAIKDADEALAFKLRWR